MNIYNESQIFLNIRYKYEENNNLSENWKTFNELYWNNCEEVEDNKLQCFCGSLIKKNSKIGHFGTKKHYLHVRSMMDKPFRKRLSEIRKYIYTSEYFKDEQKEIQEKSPVVNLPQFFIDDFKKYLNLSNEELECPICYENMKDNLSILSCGHKTCTSCIQKCDKCPICRRKYFKI